MIIDRQFPGGAGRSIVSRANMGRLGGSVARTACVGRPWMSIDFEESKMNVGYMLIPVVLFVGGIIVSSALFSLGMKRVTDKQ